MNAIRCLAMALLGAVPLGLQEPTEETFQEWYAFILPKGEELGWRKIPWRSTLWEAALEARTKDMPILLWAMNGHPLDCT